MSYSSVSKFDSKNEECDVIATKSINQSKLILYMLKLLR